MAETGNCHCRDHQYDGCTNITKYTLNPYSGSVVTVFVGGGYVLQYSILCKVTLPVMGSTLCDDCYREPPPTPVAIQKVEST